VSVSCSQRLTAIFFPSLFLLLSSSRRPSPRASTFSRFRPRLFPAPYKWPSPVRPVCPPSLSDSSNLPSCLFPFLLPLLGLTFH
jgi:hypothetical protein